MLSPERLRYPACKRQPTFECSRSLRTTWGRCPGEDPGLCAGGERGVGSHPAARLCVCVRSLAGLWAGWSEWTDGQFGGANEATQCYHRLSLLTALDEAIIIPEHCSIPGFHTYHPRTPPHKIILFPVPLLQAQGRFLQSPKRNDKKKKKERIIMEMLQNCGSGI